MDQSRFSPLPGRVVSVTNLFRERPECANQVSNRALRSTRLAGPGRAERHRRTVTQAHGLSGLLRRNSQTSRGRGPLSSDRRARPGTGRCPLSSKHPCVRRRVHRFTHTVTGPDGAPERSTRSSGSRCAPPPSQRTCSARCRPGASRPCTPSSPARTNDIEVTRGVRLLIPAPSAQKHEDPVSLGSSDTGSSSDCAPPGTRTPNPVIKSHLLCQLS